MLYTWSHTGVRSVCRVLSVHLASVNKSRHLVALGGHSTLNKHLLELVVYHILFPKFLPLGTLLSVIHRQIFYIILVRVSVNRGGGAVTRSKS